ncbi:MAG TPA: Rossmann-like and DUF2520 domain-containing protein [Rubricoccaceae bacterium]|jgi:predicted short-subunit dehydrogenase-like oxidoreductase (DUF2520 family)
MEVYASAFRDSRPGVAIVGAGAMGRALALRLADRGYPVRAVISRTRASAEALARAVGAPLASDRLSDLPADVALVALCVPDGQLADLAETLTGVHRSWGRTVVLHTSGALPASALAPLAAEGADTLAFHPLQAVVRDSDAHTLDGVYVGLEGEPRAVAAGVELAVGLGLRYVVVSAEAKPRVHLAAVMASNFVVTLLGVVQEVLTSVGIDRRDGMAMLAPLLQGTLDNLTASSPEDALTGPVARGDVETLRQHGLALRAHLPHLVPAYAALSVETVRIAVRSGALSPERAEAVLDLMQRMVTTPLPPRAGPGSPGAPARPAAEPERPAPSPPVPEWAPGP